MECGDGDVRDKKAQLSLTNPRVTTRLAPLIATPRLPWDSCNM